MRRTQMRMGPGAVTPMVKKLIIANGVIFFLQLLMGPGHGISTREGLGFLGTYFSLVPEYVVEYLFIWQLITYQFLHGNLFHILINMFVLWMFGTELERVWNQEGFLRFYLVCGVAAGLTMIVFNYGTIPTVGASGAIFGLLGAFAYFWPEREVLVFFLFPMKVKHFVILIGAIELYASVSGSMAGFANIAHVGGLVTGLLYIRYDDPRNSLLKPLKRWFKKQKVKRKKKQWRKEQQRKNEMVKEADEILDRLQDLSWDELSDREKKRIREISDELKDMD